jgi:hypothetical protein
LFPQSSACQREVAQGRPRLAHSSRSGDNQLAAWSKSSQKWRHGLAVSCCSEDQSGATQGLKCGDWILSIAINVVMCPELPGDSGNSQLIEVEAGHGIALCIPIFKLVTGERLVYQLISGMTELASIGIARAAKGDVTPAGEKFGEILRETSAARRFWLKASTTRS